MAASPLSSLTALVGRILLSLIFLWSGISKITGFHGVAAMMAERMPYATALLMVAIVIEIGGALMIILGWRARLAGWVLFLYLIPVTLVFHAFWHAPPAMAYDQMIHFWKNIAIMGGLLMVAGQGPGGLSVRR